MRTLLVVTHSLTRTGAPKVAIDICRHFKDAYRVVLLNVNSTVSSHERRTPPGQVDLIDFPRRLYSAGFWLKITNRIIRIVSLRRFSLKKIWMVYFLMRIKPDVVLFNTFYHADLQDPCNILGICAIRYLHENIGYLSELSTNEMTVFNSSYRIIGCSPSVVNDAKKNGLHCETDFYPAVTDELLNAVSKLKKSYKTSKLYDRRIVTVGSGMQRKGAKYAEEAAAKMAQARYDWYGQIEDPSVFSNINYQGMVEKVPYEKYSAYFLVSIEDPWPIVVMEALSEGVAIFGWNHLSIINALEEEGLAIGVSPFDVSALCAAYEGFDFEKYQDKVGKIEIFLKRYSSHNIYSNKLARLIEDGINGIK